MTFRTFTLKKRANVLQINHVDCEHFVVSRFHQSLHGLITQYFWLRDVDVDRHGHIHMASWASTCGCLFSKYLKVWDRTSSWFLKTASTIMEVGEPVLRSHCFLQVIIKGERTLSPICHWTERQHKQPVGRLRHTFNTSFNFSYESSNTKVIVLKIRSQCVRRDVGQISKKKGRYRNKYIQGIRVIRVCITEEGELKYFYYKWYKCNGTWWSSISFQFYWNDLLCFLLTQNTTPLVFSTLFGRSDLKAPEGMGLNIGLKHI